MRGIGGISPVRRGHERDRVKHYPSVSTSSGNESTDAGVRVKASLLEFYRTRRRKRTLNIFRVKSQPSPVHDEKENY